jgi:hypothetical protein
MEVVVVYGPPDKKMNDLFGNLGALDRLQGGQFNCSSSYLPSSGQRSYAVLTFSMSITKTKKRLNRMSLLLYLLIEITSYYLFLAFFNI